MPSLQNKITIYFHQTMTWILSYFLFLPNHSPCPNLHSIIIENISKKNINN